MMSKNIMDKINHFYYPSTIIFIAEENSVATLVVSLKNNYFKRMLVYQDSDKNGWLFET